MDGGCDIISWEGPAVGLLDLDAFFASVEQLDHPAWRGRPVIVGGSAERRGVVSTASYEARAYGVHSAMPSYQARRLCPDAIWTCGDHARYREVSDRVMACVLDETPLMEQVSIDEAFFDVTPGRFSREDPIAICRRIQQRVAKLGVTCSIGIGTSKTVAKIASERQKPQGLTVVPPGSEAAFLAPLPVRSMSGIGHATQARLAEMGIRTLGALARQDRERMGRIFGAFGPHMVDRASGTERSPVRAIDDPEAAKSVSSERTFAQDLTTEDEVRAAIDHVSGLVGTRLRKRGLAGSQVTLKLKYDVLHAHTAQRQLVGPTDDEHAFGRVAQELLCQVWHEGTPVRLVGVSVSGFGGAGARQLSLFGEGEVPDRPQRDLRSLSVAADEVRRRFGAESISFGRDLRFKGKESDTLPMGAPKGP